MIKNYKDSFTVEFFVSDNIETEIPSIEWIACRKISLINNALIEIYKKYPSGFNIKIENEKIYHQENNSIKYRITFYIL